jgi:hypothetical protein
LELGRKTPNALSTSFLADSCHWLNFFSLFPIGAGSSSRQVSGRQMPSLLEHVMELFFTDDVRAPLSFQVNEGSILGDSSRGDMWRCSRVIHCSSIGIPEPKMIVCPLPPIQWLLFLLCQVGTLPSLGTFFQ